MEKVVSLFGVQPIRIGGVEVFTRELTRQLASKGARHVAIFGGKPIEAVARYLDLPNLSIEVVPTLEASLWQSLGPVDVILRRHRPDTLHIHFVDFLGPLVWLARLRGVRRIYFTAHGSHPPDHVPRRAVMWKRFAARAINWPLTGVFCVSEYTRRAFTTVDFISRDRVHLLYDAIELPDLPQQTDFRRRFGIPEEKDLVVQVSWIIPEKGVPDLLDAAKLVIEKRPGTHFAIVGDGEYLEGYRQRTRELGLAGSVTFTGMLENPMRDGVYAAADVFCLASRWQEAFGWVIAEAMSFEKPVVATNVGGIPEVVEDGKTGTLSPPGNPARLADSLLRLLGDLELRRRFGRAARERVESNFELRSNIGKLVKHYAI